MILFFIPDPILSGDLLDRLGKALHRASDKEWTNSQDQVLPHTSPYTVAQAGEIYNEAVNVASTMEITRNPFGEAAVDVVHRLTEMVNSTAIEFGRNGSYTQTQLVEALQSAGRVIEAHPPKDINPLRKGWIEEEINALRRILPLVVKPSPVDPLAGAVGEGDLERHHPPAESPDFPEPGFAINSDASPYTIDQSDQMHEVCTGLAAAFQTARGVSPKDHLKWFPAELAQRALHIGEETQTDFAILIAAVEAVAGSIDNYIWSLAQGPRWWFADAECFSRMVRHTLGLAQAAQVGADRRRAAKKVGSQLTGEALDLAPESRGATVLVSTTDTAVRLHHDGVGEHYEIGLADIANPRGLLRWVSHLGGKRWVTAKMLHLFVTTVCSLKGWELYDFSAEHSQEVS